MKYRLNSGSLLKLTAIILVVIAIFWFFVEGKSPNSQKIPADSSSAITNNPAQWEEPKNANSKSDRGEGSVTLTAEYLPDKSDETAMSFNLYLNTHSVDLTSVDFKRDIYLEKDGKKIYSTASLDSGGGHHRSSRLTFEKVDFPLYIIGENIGGVGRREILFEL